MSPSRLGSNTVHEGWPLTRLLSAVAFVRRTWTVRIVRRLAIVTVAVPPLAVVVPPAPAAASGEEVIHFHSVARREEQAALRTLAVLSLQASGDSGRDLRVVSEASPPIDPIAIIGTAPTVDLPMTPDRRVAVSRHVGTSVRGLNDPAVALGHAPVPRGDPPLACVGMAVGRPSAPHPIEPVVQTREETSPAATGVLPRPPQDDRVEPSDQSRLVRMAMAFYECASWLAMVLDGPGTGHDPCLIAQPAPPCVFG
jgi:hypothetical protein